MLHTVVTASNECYRARTEPVIKPIAGRRNEATATFIDAETGDEITVGPVKAICSPLRQ